MNHFLSVCMFVCLYVGHTFFETLIFYNLYILKIYLIDIKSFSLKITIFLFSNFFKGRLCSNKNLDFLQFIFFVLKSVIFCCVYTV